MVEADPVMRAARNGYFVLLLALFCVSAYQFAFVEQSDPVVPALWATGVIVFYGSKYYYIRQEPPVEEKTPDEE